MSSTTAHPELDTREQLVRIDRSLAESLKLRAETEKLVSEGAKLFAETQKLFAEERKLQRDRASAPWVVIGTLGGVVVGAVGAAIALARALGAGP